MSFLQPLLLAALPLIGLPVLIHLINQRRYQTMNWAAMNFLLAANRMSRGYARLRQWLILLFRMVAIAGLIFAMSRPLASGWLGLTAGGRVDTTLILLDCSPSMQQQGNGAVASKLKTGRQQLVKTLNTLGSSHWVLIDGTTNRPHRLESPDDLLSIPSAMPTSTSSDLPAMLRAAHEYVKNNQTGRTEIWVCSDLRENDWNASSARWKRLRDDFAELPQSVRFHLLAYPHVAENNVTVRVTDVRRSQIGSEAELLISLRLTRVANPDDTMSVPVQFEIEGARSEITVEITGSECELKDHRIALEDKRKRGWGRVSIPADSNRADNDFYFAFDEAPTRKTIIIADDPHVARPLKLAAAISPAPSIDCEVDVVPLEQMPTIEWERTALLLWQAPLPTDEEAEMVVSFVQRGGQVVFFPSLAPGSDPFMGARWGSWRESSGDLVVKSWRGDQDLLRRTRSGAALPVGRLKIRRHCTLSGEFTSLATLDGGDPLLTRVSTNRGGVYFCSTTAAADDSSLATNGVVLYVAIQRALATGAEVLGNTRQLVAGKRPEGLPTSWRRLSGEKDALSTEYSFHRGLYSVDDRLLAVNRAEDEDQGAVLSDARMGQLFRGLDFTRVDSDAGSANSLIQEVWRLFLATMMISLMVEAGLCLPKLRPTNPPPLVRAEGVAV
jgi:hypothetical protein